jgi:hypothetical protein
MWRMLSARRNRQSRALVCFTPASLCLGAVLFRPVAATTVVAVWWWCSGTRRNSLVWQRGLSTKTPLVPPVLAGPSARLLAEDRLAHWYH